MREVYQSELDLISEELALMCTTVGRAMSKATRSLMDADLEVAEEVIAGDRQVDELAHQIDDRCYTIAAQQQPVARDLRIVMSGLRMSASLERMGDLAKHIAKQTRLRYPKPVLPREVSTDWRRQQQLRLRRPREDLPEYRQPWRSSRPCPHRPPPHRSPCPTIPQQWPNRWFRFRGRKSSTSAGRLRIREAPRSRRQRRRYVREPRAHRVPPRSVVRVACRHPA